MAIFCFIFTPFTDQSKQKSIKVCYSINYAIGCSFTFVLLFADKYALLYDIVAMQASLEF
jgi:hypothetical protein